MVGKILLGIFFILYFRKIKRPLIQSKNKKVAAMTLSLIFPLFIIFSGLFQTLLRNTLVGKPHKRSKKIELFLHINKEIILHVDQYEIDQTLPASFFDRFCVYVQGYFWKTVIAEEENTMNNVVIMHGLNGNSDCNYVINTANVFLDKNCRVFCLNARGINKSTLKNTNFTHVGEIEDINIVCNYIKQFYTGKILLVGFSQGSNQVTKYLAEYKNESSFMFEKREDNTKLSLNCDVIKTKGKNKLNEVIMGVISVCNPFHPIKLEKIVSEIPIFGKKAIETLVETFQDHLCKVLSHVKNIKEIVKGKTCYEITQNLFNAKILKGKTCEKFMIYNACINFISKLNKPILFVNTVDDPIIPTEIIPLKEIEENENAGLVLLEGGHLGFKTINSKFSLKNVMETYYDLINVK